MKILVIITCIGVLIVSALAAFKLESSAPADIPQTAAATATTEPKQLWTCGMHPQVIQDHPGICPICHMKLTPLKTDDENSSGGDKKKIAYWWDPMLGPASISNHPGKSAMGMDMVPVYENDVSAGPAVRIDPTVVQNMGVTTATVVRGPLNVTVRAVGMLEVPEPGLHDVTLKINGYIQKLYADTEGMSVAKDQVLFDLYSPDLQVAEQELITAEQNLKSLDAKASDAVREDAHNLVDSAKQKLRLWDIAERDIDALASSSEAPKTLPFRSPADGHVVDKMVVEGSAVQAGMKVMRIEDHSKLWLDAQVYEDQIPVVKIGEEVHAFVDAVPGKTFTGKVSFIYPHLDHMLRTETVRTTLDNPNHELRPGMYATAEIMTRAVPDAILVPRESVIDTGTQQMAFVTDTAAAGHFEPRIVRTGMAGDDDKVQIVQGLVPGDQVVTSGQFLMDVESRTTEAIEKLRKGSGSDMMSVPSTNPGPGQELMHSTMPISDSSEATASQLVVIHCSMRNADWLQFGTAVANPYMGSSMSTCGEVTRQLKSPAPGSSIAGILQAYLKVGSGLDHDMLDAAAIEDLSKQSAADDTSDSLRSAVAHLSAAKDIESARTAFQEVSSAITAQLAAATN